MVACTLFVWLPCLTVVNAAFAVVLAASHSPLHLLCSTPHLVMGLDKLLSQTSDTGKNLSKLAGVISAWRTALARFGSLSLELYWVSRHVSHGVQLLIANLVYSCQQPCMVGASHTLFGFPAGANTACKLMFKIGAAGAVDVDIQVCMVVWMLASLSRISVSL